MRLTCKTCGLNCVPNNNRCPKRRENGPNGHVLRWDRVVCLWCETRNEELRNQGIHERDLPSPVICNEEPWFLKKCPNVGCGVKLHHGQVDHNRVLIH